MCGEPYILLRISGISFVLHQIRHMIGTALAVAHGVLPPDAAELRVARAVLAATVPQLAARGGLQAPGRAVHSGWDAQQLWRQWEAAARRCGPALHRRFRGVHHHPGESGTRVEPARERLAARPQLRPAAQPRPLV